MDESYKNPDHILIDVYWNKNYPQTGKSCASSWLISCGKAVVLNHDGKTLVVKVIVVTCPNLQFKKGGLQISCFLLHMKKGSPTI